MTQINAKPPFRYCDLTGSVYGKDAFGGETKVCDIRGWGYLTGQGHCALGLDNTEARKIQEQTGELIAAALNEKVIE